MKLLVGVVLAFIIFISGCINQVEIIDFRGDITYFRDCMNSIEEAEDDLLSKYNVGIINRSEDEKSYTLEISYWSENKKYLYSYKFPKCSYFEFVSNSCDNETCAVLHTENIDNTSSLDAVLLYLNLSNNRHNRHINEIKSIEVNEIDDFFIVNSYINVSPFVMTATANRYCYFYFFNEEYYVNKETGEISLKKEEFLEETKWECN